VHSLYWCRHCVHLRCARCVSQEVDSYFCPSCLDEHMPSTEAKLNRNRCTTGCMTCPVCPSNLSYVPTGDGKDMFLSCGFCQWNSEEIQLTGTKEDVLKAVKDQSGNQEADDRMKVLMETYQERAKDESRKKELARQSVTQALYRKGRGMYSRFSSYQKGAQMNNKKKMRSNLIDRQNKVYDEARNEWVEITDNTSITATAITAAEMKSSDVSGFTAAAVNDVNEITTLAQRLQNMHHQPTDVTQIWPACTNLVAKRSKRCRECQHNLIKPELSPMSIKYKMQLFASQYIPSIKVAQLPPLKVGERAQVVLVLTNPLDQALTISVRPITTLADESAGEADADAPAVADDGAAAAPGGEAGVEKFPEATSAPADGSEPEPVERKPLSAVSSLVSERPLVCSNAEVVGPTEELIVAEHDPVMDYVHDSQPGKYQDNPEVVHKRSGNSLYFYTFVTPTEADAVVSITLELNYKYTANVPGIRSSVEQAPSKKSHDVKLFSVITLGRVEAASDATVEDVAPTETPDESMM